MKTMQYFSSAKSSVDLHCLFYINTYTAPYVGGPILYEDIISWDMYLIMLHVLMYPSFTDTENIKLSL